MRALGACRSITALLVASAVTAVGAGASQAATPAVGQEAAVIAVSDLMAHGYSEEEVERALADSPYVSIEVAPVQPGSGGVSARGVTFGHFIYVRVSQAQAKAIAQGSTWTAVGVLGLATGGIGLLVAAAVYSYVGSLNDSYPSRCARWEFKVTYPAPFINPRIVSARCL